MKTLICHGCGSEKKVYIFPREFCCKDCGAVNVVPLGEGTSNEPIGCIPPKGFEWTLPAGVKADPTDKKIYITAQGSEMTKKEFMDVFGCDPDIMRTAMRKLGIEGVEGFKNLSTLGKKGPK